MSRNFVVGLRLGVGRAVRCWLVVGAIGALGVAPARVAASWGASGRGWEGCATAQPAALTLDEVLARVRGAIGVEALASRAGPIYMSGTGEFTGMPCTIEQVLAPDGRAFRRVNAAITMESGYDGERHWVRDIGGEFRVLGLGNEVEAEITGAMLSGAWATGASPLTLALGEGDGGSVVVAFTIAGTETSGRILIDPSTWLPTRWEFTSGASTQTLELEGAASLDGFTTARAVTQSSSEGTANRYGVESLRAATAEEAAWLAPVTASPSDTTWDPAVSGVLEVRRAPTGHLLVHPMVDGKDVGWFIFDSGAGANVLASGALEALGVEAFGEVPAVGVGGTTRARFVRPSSVAIGPMTYAEPLMVEMDLAFLEPYMGVKVGGILGFSFLARCVAEVDFAEGRISIHDPAAFDRSTHPWTPMVLDERIPCVRASIEGHEGWFRLDTGANGYVTIHEPAVRALGLLDGREAKDSQLGGVGGFVKAKKVTLSSFEIGGQRIEGMVADLAIERVGAFGDANSMGNIGNTLIRRFRVVFDYPHSRLAFLAREEERGK